VTFRNDWDLYKKPSITSVNTAIATRRRPVADDRVGPVASRPKYSRWAAGIETLNKNFTEFFNVRKFLEILRHSEFLESSNFTMDPCLSSFS